MSKTERSEATSLINVYRKQEKAMEATDEQTEKDEISVALVKAS